MRHMKFAAVLVCCALAASPVFAQEPSSFTVSLAAVDQAKPAPATQKPATQKPPAKPKVPEPKPKMGFRGYFIVENTAMSASSTFNAVFGSSSMVGFGGGGEVLNLWKKVFVRAAVTSASNTGNRAFLLDAGLVSTNVPVEVSITTVELSAGWRQTLRKHPRFSLYGGGGLIIANYTETSSFAQAADDSTLGSNGYSVFGGMEAVVWKYVIAGVEGQYKSIGGVLGEGGLSKAYAEDNLGGAAIRGMVGVRFMKKK